MALLGCVGAIPRSGFFSERARARGVVWWALSASHTSTRAGSMSNPKTTLYVGTSSPVKAPWLASPDLPCARRVSIASAFSHVASTPFPSPHFLAGGLDEQVTEAVLHAAFLPFGDLKDVNIPLDQQTQKNRGFGFVTFMEKCVPRPAPLGTLNARSPPRGPAHPPQVVSHLLRSFQPMFHRREDAVEAMNNMHNGELYGRVIRCNYAQPQRIKDGSAQPVWADADRYEAERAADEAEERAANEGDAMAGLEAQVD